MINKSSFDWLFLHAHIQKILYYLHRAVRQNAFDGMQLGGKYKVNNHFSLYGMLGYRIFDKNLEVDHLDLKYKQC